MPATESNLEFHNRSATNDVRVLTAFCVRFTAGLILILILDQTDPLYPITSSLMLIYLNILPSTS